MARFVQHIVLVVVVAVLVAAAPPAKAPPAKAPPAKAPAAKAPAAKAPAAKAPAAKAPAANAPAAKAPATPAANPTDALLKDPAVTDLIAKVKNGQKPDSRDIMAIAIKGMMSGVETSNPDLNKITKTVNETLKAMKESPNGQLSTGQTLKISTTLFNSVAKATNTSAENAAKFRACGLAGAKPSAKANEAEIKKALEKTFTDCFPLLGDGTKEGNVKAVNEFMKFIPPSISSLIDGKGMQGLINGIGNSGGISSFLNSFAMGSTNLGTILGVKKNLGS